ncbi:MAG: LysM peptidoglycan-binding domain-containing protein [Chloroflexi bacterium]|nr:LysM peptidoglycan-binding domain-containing protein [Chloroflexota bacterium]
MTKPRAYRLLAVLVVIVLFLVTVPGARAQEQVVHVVQAGENLFRLALRYGTTVEALVAANRLSSADSIQVGQRLVIPGSRTATSPVARSGPAMTTGGTYVVQKGDTLSGIALRYGVNLWELRKANGLLGTHLIFPGQALVLPGAGGTVPEAPPETSDTYVVRSGDTLSAIAARFNTTAFALARNNGIADPSLIREGQVLRVPRQGLGRPGSPQGRKQILISLSEQHLYAYEGDWLVYSFVASTGRAPYYTRCGDFQVQSKIPNAYGGAWDIWMPHWLGIYWAGGSENGIHALPIDQSGQTLWAGYLGTPISFGCIVLGTAEAKALYDWAEIGTPVKIRS